MGGTPAGRHHQGAGGVRPFPRRRKVRAGAVSNDSDIVYFSKQEKIYPRSVKGRYRTLRWLAMAALLGIYYAVPWLRWDRGPHVPDQAVLIDMPSRRAYFFNIEIWPQEVYLLAGLLVLAAIGLFFVTSLFGRVWCGYACPQTVWTDLFIAVERFLQGDRNTQMRRDKGPWTFEKVWKKTATHIVWIIIALCTGGAWVFYFNDAPTLFDQIRHFDVSPVAGGWILGLTASTYFMAGFAREQVCTYACPYARFQSAMFDPDTLIISYDRERGEPRGKHKLGQSWEGRGHCIDCTQCVIVCPAGIDIREGLQMECIACGLCVDACNDVMDRMTLPRGLIRYDTENNYQARKEGRPVEKPLRLLRPRTIYYTLILTVVGAVTLYALVTRTKVELHALHDRNPLYVKLSDGSIRNAYTVKILNKTHQDRSFSLSVGGMAVRETKIVSSGDIDPRNIGVLADSVGQFRVMLTADRQDSPRKEIEITATENNGALSAGSGTVFMSGEEK
ncbi:MAG: cytochrome c oxidase accessory protein CcoG [Alphaproteobacteria bacterium]|nr:cytochrome c oxidase accessory protein CcoG [Alphaproteobacteria bacterium]